ncbi:MAG: YigZ family protein [Clostridia bacterium]|nr:YigZ family protein [Clostridia bacterium]
MFKTIAQNAESLVVEKKSKFIGNVYSVETIEEAEKIIEQTKKKYHDARHNCYAYRIIEEDRIIEKQNDDGEPSGTAGAPMLNILTKKNLNNVLIIVTRYFGGILLGTGGLVKAYSDASIQAIEKAKEIEKEKGYIVEVITEYDKQAELEYICEKNNIKIVKKEYTEKIKNLVEISEEKYGKIFKEKNKNGEYNFKNEIKQKKYI